VPDPISADIYRFRPVAIADLALVRRWLAEPHVAQWWGDADEQFARVHNDFDEPAMEQFIVVDGDLPFGYVQSYDLAAWPDDAFGIHPPGTRAIDQFIGELDMIECGHGSAFIREFIAGLVATGTPRVITDPDPANARAIRAYEKAGFHRDRVVDTRSGPALLMVCNP
jgi:aminoglycoside 6'-N-acetyltransferase